MSDFNERDRPKIYRHISMDPPEVQEDFRDTFRVTVSNGEEWVDISDGFDFWVSPEGFGNRQVSWRKEEAQSRYYDGTFLLHATKDNITENVTVYVRGESQNDVTENILMLKDLFSQLSYRVRVQFGNHRETWYCQTANWTEERSHVLMHNSMAKLSFTIPRLPRTTEEIIL